MNAFNHWMVGLDLTNMDDLVLGYLDFLSGINEPEHLTFIHVVEDEAISEELNELFPEVEASKSLEDIIREELQKKVNDYFKAEGPHVNIIIREGSTTETLLSALNEFDPDLLVLGKKTGYEGEGILARKITKYAHCSLLFVAENSQYKLENIHVPITFSKASARALKEAQKMSDAVGAEFHVQHVYHYPAQFFPYIPSDKYSERMNKYLNKKYDKFKKKYDLKNIPKCTFTVKDNGKDADQIYDLTLRTRADLIMVGAKSKTSAAALLTDEMADSLADYHFGVPVFIHKEKEEHIGLLKSLLDKD
ncbi:universal stress protein [Fodinibius sp.]|uniref:universal stress protein n=1 Tax=Fodinibius sp. TaxID=1872440 RepID=UPI002ACDFA86|nr:universal stress protein [Fodinibius sp.]MDZ7660314.1 universal stress protein [Fodinibius sp.]